MEESQKPLDRRGKGCELSEEQKTQDLVEWAKRKKEQQHAAYRRWYTSDKGKAYRQKLKERKALEAK